MPQENQKTINPYQLAKTFELQIKNAITKKFSVPSNELKLLLEHDNGVYLSQEEANTLCCFVLGQKNGFLYLVTGEINQNGENLTNFKAGIIS
jgi:hypothetical protein